MRNYLDLMQHVLSNGTQKSDRTGTGTLSVFGAQLRFDLNAGFPLLTTKKVHLKSILHELLWFLKGETNTKYLKEHGVSIWDEWAGANGDLGPVYGYQWRSWPAPDGRHIDQISQVLEQIRKNPDSRRMIVSAWNVADLAKMALHALSCVLPVLRRRRAALVPALPAQRRHLSRRPFQYRLVRAPYDDDRAGTGLKPGDFVHTFGDTHLYMNHLEQAREQLSRQPRKLPIMRLNPAVKNLFDFKYEDFTLENYDPHPAIKAPVAV